MSVPPGPLRVLSTKSQAHLELIFPAESIHLEFHQSVWLETHLSILGSVQLQGPVCETEGSPC